MCYQLFVFKNRIKRNLFLSVSFEFSSLSFEGENVVVLFRINLQTHFAAANRGSCLEGETKFPNFQISKFSNFLLSYFFCSSTFVEPATLLGCDLIIGIILNHNRNRSQSVLLQFFAEKFSTRRAADSNTFNSPLNNCILRIQNCRMWLSFVFKNDDHKKLSHKLINLIFLTFNLFWCFCWIVNF